MKVKILKYDDLGNGICLLDNKICFVKRALPLEVANIKIIKDKKSYSEAIILNLITSSEKRIKPNCLFYDKCGGCNFQHINDLEEKKFKIEKLKRYFNRLDNFYTTKNYYYRNKITLHVKNGVVGLYNEKSNDLIEIDFCYLISKKMNDVIKIFNNLRDNSFNGKILIRENSDSEIIVSVDGCYKYINTIKDDVTIDNLIYNDIVLKGKDYFIEKILSYQFKVHYKSFFQVNRLGLEKIFLILSNFLKGKKINTVLDLYSGTSVLGIYIASYVQNVISIESNSFATADACENIKINNVNNLKVVNGLVENNIDNFKNIDLIVVDPARRGLDKKTINYLNVIKSQYIIYIACGIDSLKRDLKQLSDNYKILELYGIDMFPKTNNIETIALLRKK